jgi:hypothetical protein
VSTRAFGAWLRVGATGATVLTLGLALPVRAQSRAAPNPYEDSSVVAALISRMIAARSDSEVSSAARECEEVEHDMYILRQLGRASVPESLAVAARDIFLRRASTEAAGDRRLLAARGLALLGPRARTELVILASSPDTSVAIVSLHAIAAIVRITPAPAATVPISRRLGDPSEGVRRAAHGAMLDVGPAALALLDSLSTSAGQPTSDLARQAAAEIRMIARVTNACFQIVPLHWAPPGDKGRSLGGIYVPLVIRLSRIPSRWDLSNTGLITEVEAANGSRESERGPGTWSFSRDHPDSLLVVWSNGFSGAYANAAIFGDTLRGSLHTFMDIKPSADDIAEFVAHRVECSPR